MMHNVCRISLFPDLANLTDRRPICSRLQFAMNTTPEINSASTFGIQEDRSSTIVLASGMATTALALLGVYVLDVTTEDVNIMGLYADYVLPVGAVMVGLVASSGYGVASWFSGAKITRKLLWTVLAFQFIAYFAAQYIEFNNLHLVHRNGSPVGFFEYYDFMARTFAWKQDKGGFGEPLGIWGYAFRGLEVLGFVGGSLIVPAVLRKAPYCESCQRYMKTRELILWAASVPAKKIKKSDAAAIEAHRAEQQRASENGKETWTALKQAASTSNAAEFNTKILSLKPERKAAGKLPSRLNLKLVHCRRCCSGWLRLDLVTGQGREITNKELERVPVQEQFVRAINSPADQFQI
jgi:hypothetical protein